MIRKNYLNGLTINDVNYENTNSCIKDENYINH